MVIYTEPAAQDLEDILYGLITWDKHPLTFEHSYDYVHDLRAECDKLDEKLYHFTASYEEHLQYGKYVFSYKRNARTTWYVIYDIDNNDIYINKIISNYVTKM